MPALLFDAEKASRSQACQMAARGLRRDAGDPSQLGSRQRAPAHQRMQHSGAGWVPCKGSDFCEAGQAGHCSHLVRAATFYAFFRPDASVTTVTIPVFSVQTAGMKGTWQTAVANGIRANLAKARIWLVRAKTRGRLHELDTRELEDIGRGRECAKWFWQA